MPCRIGEQQDMNITDWTPYYFGQGMSFLSVAIRGEPLSPLELFSNGWVIGSKNQCNTPWQWDSTWPEQPKKCFLRQ